MAACYQGKGGQFVAHKDHHPPEDEDTYWLWKSQTEMSDRFVTVSTVDHRSNHV